MLTRRLISVPPPWLVPLLKNRPRSCAYFEKRVALLARQQKAQPGVKAPLVERLGAGAKPDVYDIRNLPRGKD